MWRDRIVEEVRAERDAYAKKFNYDLDLIYLDLKALETKSGRKVVMHPPKHVISLRRKIRQRKQKMA